MSVRIRLKVRLVVIRALTCGVALGVAGCASEPVSNEKPAPMSRVNEALSVITDNYVDPIETSVLVNACLRKLPQPAAATGVRREDTGEHSVRDVAAIFAGLPAQDADAAAESCIRGMVAILDAHSQFLDAEDFNDIKGTSRPRAAIGLELEPAAEGAKIVIAFEGTPAASADIVSGDLLTAVDDVDLKGRPLNEIIRLLRGTPGSSVTITVQRAQSASPLRLTLIREMIKVKSFDGRGLEHGFVYLRTRQLTERVPNELAETIARVRRENKGVFRGMILDLRNCPGGLLHDGIAVTAAFLPPGTLVTETKGRTSDSSRRYSAVPGDYWRGAGTNPFADLPPELKSAPIVVLIDAKTGSGCEIVASALQDHKRAVVIGERSLGNGLIQTVIPLLPRTALTQPALKITTGRIYRPNGESLDGRGVEPDIVIPWPMKGSDGTAISVAAQARLFGSSDDPVAIGALEILKSASPGGPPLQ